jgi:hypothetical protein
MTARPGQFDFSTSVSPSGFPAARERLTEEQRRGGFLVSFLFLPNLPMVPVMARVNLRTRRLLVAKTSPRIPLPVPGPPKFNMVAI